MAESTKRIGSRFWGGIRRGRGRRGNGEEERSDANLPQGAVIQVLMRPEEKQQQRNLKRNA